MERAAGDADRNARHAVLVVQSRARPIVIVGIAGALLALGMFALRQDDLEIDDALMTALLLGMGLWLAAQAVGLVLRRLEAGHAMKIDRIGLHHPGWAVVPWSAVRGVWLQRSKKVLGYRRQDLMLDIEPGCNATAGGGYVRWMFGPVEGLWRRDKPIAITLIGLSIDPDTLLDAIHAMRRAASLDANASHPTP